MDWPIGLAPGQNARAVASLTIATCAEPRASSLVKARPRAIGSRRIEKNSGDTNVNRVGVTPARSAGPAATLRERMNSGFPPVTANSAMRGSDASASASRGSSCGASPRTFTEYTPRLWYPRSMAPMDLK
ncbi:MAG: hypothetical protein M3473_02185, partial [Chloroflexota bacterium]|nr:hypothetical protein [Chloroflexota bacterium]